MYAVPLRYHISTNIEEADVSVNGNCNINTVVESIPMEDYSSSSEETATRMSTKITSSLINRTRMIYFEIASSRVVNPFGHKCAHVQNLHVMWR